MYLLNTKTLKIELFPGGSPPPYAILSHTWQKEEILFRDIQTDEWRSEPRKQGADKVENACRQARYHGFRYIWIDSCCIDKDSSAELSDAINSMFIWYRDSEICYAYLSDVVSGDLQSFKQSRWFTRGWTLQELIAPTRVEFFDGKWRGIGDRVSLLKSVLEITGIDRRVLSREHHPYCEHLGNIFNSQNCNCRGRFENLRDLLSSFSIATRMTWARRRTTTRTEDIAYSLLGLFDVNIPLLYGEGTRAFQRLQQEIIRTHNDQSVLAHTRRNSGKVVALFAESPDDFYLGAELDLLRPRVNTSGHLAMTLTNRCLNLNMPLYHCRYRYGSLFRSEGHAWLGILDCVYSDDHLSRPAILLERPSSTSNEENVFTRLCPDFVIRISPEDKPDDDGIITVTIEDWTGLEVRFNPKLIETRDVNLLIPNHRDPVRQEEHPFVRIKPRVVQPSGMTYQIRMSFPDLLGDSGGNISSKANTGFVGLDDGCSHGFFVVWGFRHASAPPKFKPWCRVMEWNEAARGQKRIPARFEEDGRPKIRLSEMVPFKYCVPTNSMNGGSRFLRALHPIARDEPSHTVALDGINVRAEMTPKTFMGQTLYELEVSVWR